MSSCRSMVYNTPAIFSDDTDLYLFPHQEEALNRIRLGSVLLGGTGSGKSITSLAWYKTRLPDYDLIVITTAKKRNDGDWPREAKLLGINDITVDSWNNIKKYVGASKKTFFIFDEQKVIGTGAWVKAFLKIAKRSPWILLSATPGDEWKDYIPIFLANGFYRTKTEFINQHIEYDRFSKFPLIKQYHNTEKLEQLREQVLVQMDFKRKTTRDRIYVNTDYNKKQYKFVVNKRWNPFKESPIKTASEYASVLRKLIATHSDRAFHAKWIMQVTPRIIVYYNFDYERDILIDLSEKLKKPWAEYNGHKHESIPIGDEWVYLVHYSASEGWNCISTDSMMFFSLNYAWRVMEQCEGRIDRLNTDYNSLKYYYLTSESPIDKRIRKVLDKRGKFNESAWIKGAGIYFRDVISG